MEKEYIVVVKRDVDLESFDAELTATTGMGPIPNRSVEIANPRIGSKRMTHWMLTDDEADVLRGDLRVLSVEIPPDQRDDIKIVRHATQQGIFYRPTDSNDTILNSHVNWGLKRSIETTNVYGSDNVVASNGNYNYALDGTGVDVVIQDSGIQEDHPEWLSTKDELIDTVQGGVTTFNFIEQRGDIGTTHMLSNTTEYKIDDNNFIKFSTRRNKSINLTEYYDLSYEYKNDCLTAALKFNKVFYQDNDLKPSEDLFFTITLIPLTTYEREIYKSR